MYTYVHLIDSRGVSRLCVRVCVYPYVRLYALFALSNVLNIIYVLLFIGTTTSRLQLILLIPSDGAEHMRLT